MASWQGAGAQPPHTVWYNHSSILQSNTMPRRARAAATCGRAACERSPPPGPAILKGTRHDAVTRAGLPPAVRALERRAGAGRSARCATSCASTASSAPCSATRPTSWSATTCRDITHPDDRDRDEQAAARLAQGQLDEDACREALPAQRRLDPLGGAPRHADGDDRGWPPYAAVVVEDTTERKQFEASVQQARDRLALVLGRDLAGSSTRTISCDRPGRAQPWLRHRARL